MSTDDVLVRAMRALREQAEAPAPDAVLTRARVLHGVSRRMGRSKAALAAAPLAAVLVVSSAWADSRAGLGPMWSHLEGLFRVAPPAVTAAPALADARRAPARPSRGEGGGDGFGVASAVPAPLPMGVAADGLPVGAALLTVAVDALPPATEGRRRMDSEPTSELRSGAPRVAPARRPDPGGARVAAEPRDDECSHLYEVAHRAHFADRDPEAALRAWDAYLAACPDGSLAPEARYDRALTLARLGRRAEASAALRPFAAGAYGDYRGREARTLLEALRR
jgi:hypothetical protein